MKQLLFIAVFLFLSCNKGLIREPLVKSDGVPEVLSNIKVENLPGAAKISYTLPDDDDILYILAEFSTTKNEKSIAKSSVYKDFILLEGFPNTEEHDVTLYTVNRSEALSDPIEVTIKPLTPPIHDVFASLNIREDFGGIKIDLHNEIEHEYVLHTLIKDEEGNYDLYDRLYTNAKDRSVLLTNMPSKSIDFAFFFIDKWRNNSDTLFKTLTPLYEEQLDKSIWNLLYLNNDTNTPEASDNPKLMWDGDPATRYRLLASATPNPPHWLTIDIGQAAKLSRIRVNAYVTSNNNWLFNRQSPREFEIWGSNSPSQDGSWDNWIRLGVFESIKPSGLPLGKFTNEDIVVAVAGEDFSLPHDGVGYRYIRFVTLATWDARPNTYWGELTLWGQPE